jgi:hypothetical protein
MSDHEAARRQGDPGADASGSAPEREERPRPQYGEYAPEGWTWKPAEGEHTSDPAPQMHTPRSSAATRRADAAAHAPEPAPAPPTPDRPLAAARPAHPLDRMITIALLVLGALGAWNTAVSLQQMPQQIQQAYTMIGVGDFTPPAWLPTVATIGVIVQLALYAAVLGLSLLQLRAGRLAFWIPLVGGTVSVILTFVLLAVVMFSDPAYQAFLQSATSATPTPTP